MSVRIRLSRTGKKAQVSYRVVVADSRAPRNGGCIEQIGSYNPRQNPPWAMIKTDRLNYWLERGARPSLTVSQILKRQGLIGKPSPAEAKPLEPAAAATKPAE
jgi:small subunit ribosomal protein S16